MEGTFRTFIINFQITLHFYLVGLNEPILRTFQLPLVYYISITAFMVNQITVIISLGFSISLLSKSVLLKQINFH